MRSTTASTQQQRSALADVLVGAVTIVGLMVTSVLVAVAVAGFFQWTPNISPILDDGFRSPS